ncbi:CG32195 [Drosophila busckii]|uniref:CG32195 n=1 Tax=Drosophila busckii TaxID=30019 RepID=A0A0M4EJB3_DROBS|nr:CG32195 [Drosophila busckii]
MCVCPISCSYVCVCVCETMEQQPVEAALAAVTPKKRDAAYIEKALASAYNAEKLRIESFQSDVISQSGENFCSVIYRIKVTFRKKPQAELQEQSFILKDLLPLMAALGSNEKLMYEQVLPALNQILAKAHASLGEHKLSAQGITLPEAKICVHKIAQFHAASMLLLQRQPELPAQLAPSHFINGVTDDFSKVLLIDGTEFAANMVAGFEGMSSIAAKMKAQLPEVYSARMRETLQPEAAAFQVIVHGDLWVNNILINAAQQQAVIVDFQNCHLGSPAIDLLLFFYTSLQLNVLLTEQQSLLKDYHQSLCHTLTACGYAGNLPSLEQLLNEMERCLFYAYYALVCEMPICSVSPEAAKDFNALTFINAENILAKRHQLFENERVSVSLKAILPIFEQKGLLEMP